ncbi:MAG: TIGR04282 family arsenosugar biosynthesis glycosyltransferase [Salinisphaera sp.]|jgi:rSAM/selenodomain-associated transferase 1|nr:TIGR04282 family arsenosugar biosynthesis glycosyltransferase [Salinisphaera sp.]
MKPVPDLHLAVFAKPLVPGQVKTRLIPSVGAEGAVRIQRAMLWQTLATAHDVAGGQISLWVADNPDHPTLHPFRDAFAPIMRTQHGHDLGTRMRSAMATLLQENARVLLVGSDCPVLSVNNVREAVAAFDDDRTDAVFIPVEDGGYVLIGLRSWPGRHETVLDAVFNGIPWSTNQVMAQTRLQLVAAGLGWSELPTLWDVDRPEDLQRAEVLGIHDIGYQSVLEKL